MSWGALIGDLAFGDDEGAAGWQTARLQRRATQAQNRRLPCAAPAQATTSTPGGRMAKGYWIARVDVTDARGLQDLRRRQRGADRPLRRPLPRARRPLREPRGREPQPQRRHRVPVLPGGARLLAFARLPGRDPDPPAGLDASTWSSSRATTGRSPATASPPLPFLSPYDTQRTPCIPTPALHRRRMARRRLRPHASGRQPGDRGGDRQVRLPAAPTSTTRWTPPTRASRPGRRSRPTSARR